MFILLGSKPCILNSFGLLLETPRRGKLPNVPSEILLTIKLHLFNLFHVFHLLGPTCSQPGPRTQVIACYAFVWPEFSVPLGPLGLKIFHVHTFRLKTLHFEQFWTAFGNPSKGKTRERPFWNPTNYTTTFIQFIPCFPPSWPNLQPARPQNTSHSVLRLCLPEFSAPLGLKIFHVHTFRLKTLHFEQFWTAFGNPSKGKTRERPFWNPGILLTIKLHLFN